MNMPDALNHFHLLRPWWLLGIIPALLTCIWLWQQKYQAKNWQQLVDPALLSYLLDGKTTRTNPLSIFGLACIWLIGVVALAGPSWEKRPVAMEKNQEAMVIMLDLSPSMLSEDIKPSRLVRARLKIADMLRQRSDGFTALLVFAGDAHVVTPLTDDIKTINNLLPDLSPNIMPLPGSNAEAAVTRSIALLRDAGITQGDLLLLTDGITEDAQHTIANQLQTLSGFRLSILGIGTANPTPIPSSKGGFIRDRQGKIVTTQLNINELQTLAEKSRGLYRTITDTPADVNYLLRATTPLTADTQKVEREFDSWYDRGHWLVLILLPIILYCFRRGVLLTVCLIPLGGLMMPGQADALEWDDLWKNNDQQGYSAFQQEKHTQAVELFNDSDWKGSALYRAGDYNEAAKEFAKNPSAEGHYNRGNALAKAGKLDDAIKAYNQALEQDPALEDAKKNRDLLEALKKQQQNQQQNQDKNDQQKNDQQKDDQQKNDSQQNESQQNQQDQNQQEQSKNQQSQEQQQGQESSTNDQQSADQQQSGQQNQAGQQQSSASAEHQTGNEFDNQSSMPGQAGENTSEGSNSSSMNATQAQMSSADSDEKENQPQMAQPVPDDGMTDEERQAMEQWLRRVPDEPGLLLKNKFRDQYQKRRMQMYNGEWEAPENGANERW